MKEYKGITLITLIITVIVMLILAGVALSAISGDAGLFGRVQKTAELYNNQSKNEADAVDAIIDEIDKHYNGNENTSTTPEPEEPKIKNKVTVSGQADEDTEKLTKENVKDLLGRVVTNFKKEDVDKTEEITIGSKKYTVSTTYRLYYIDFDGKYGEEETIYLKADCTGEAYSIPTTGTANNSNVKLKDLNPGLYYEEEGVEIPFPNKDKARTGIPNSNNTNMKAVTWLTNTKNWEDLINRENVNSEIQGSINYIVGAPSLEMMFDSYNTHYGLNGETSLEGPNGRVKLFYKYPFISKGGVSYYYGYAVGHSRNSSTKEGYYYKTDDYTVKTDPKIDSMYYPGDNKCYWLASPAAYDYTAVMSVSGKSGGGVNYYWQGAYYAFCPLVSLKSSAILELAENQSETEE